MDPNLPYTWLSCLGNAFAERFEVCKMKSPILEGLTFIDSPGVLSGEKQRVSRGYLLESVVKVFADRVDCMLIIFDVSKVDISDEFLKVMEAAKTNANKIHVLLNKADRVTYSQLNRIYGALAVHEGYSREDVDYRSMNEAYQLVKESFDNETFKDIYLPRPWKDDRSIPGVEIQEEISKLTQAGIPLIINCGAGLGRTAFGVGVVLLNIVDMTLKKGDFPIDSICADPCRHKAQPAKAVYYFLQIQYYGVSAVMDLHVDKWLEEFYERFCKR